VIDDDFKFARCDIFSLDPGRWLRMYSADPFPGAAWSEWDGCYRETDDHFRERIKAGLAADSDIGSRLTLPRLPGNTCAGRLMNSQLAGAVRIPAFLAWAHDGLAASARYDRRLPAGAADDFGLGRGGELLPAMWALHETLPGAGCLSCRGSMLLRVYTILHCAMFCHCLTDPEISPAAIAFLRIASANAASHVAPFPKG
jgi:hypothetical protein